MTCVLPVHVRKQGYDWWSIFDIAQLRSPHEISGINPPIPLSSAPLPIYSTVSLLLGALVAEGLSVPLSDTLFSTACAARTTVIYWLEANSLFRIKVRVAYRWSCTVQYCVGFCHPRVGCFLTSASTKAWWRTTTDQCGSEGSVLPSVTVDFGSKRLIPGRRASASPEVTACNRWFDSATVEMGSARGPASAWEPESSLPVFRVVCPDGIPCAETGDTSRPSLLL